MKVTVERLEELWSAAAASPVTAAFRTAALDVRTPQGPVLVAVDRQDSRHLLLPLAASHTLKQEVEGGAVVLRRRGLEDEDTYRNYASLELVDPDLGELFTALCAEVVERVAANPARAVAALREVLADWRALLAEPREVLTAGALSGLFGELYLLRRMLERDAGAVTFWTGPTGAAQDFQRADRALEVKTTTFTQGSVVYIHGLDQLDVPPSGLLFLHWLRLGTDRGISVPELVEEILDHTDDTATFRRLLAGVGYRDSSRKVYERRRFEIKEARIYEVSDGFPRITTSCLTGDATLAGMGPVNYSIDLDSARVESRRSTIDPVTALLGDS